MSPSRAALDEALAHLPQEARRAGDGRLAIANNAYSATFAAADGVVFVPRAGHRDDGARRWQYRALSLETGAGRTALAPVTPVVSTAGVHVVDFVRPGLIERYVGRAQGVEQVFVLATRPSSAGDVRIRGDVTFEGTRHTTAAGLEFRAPDRAPYTYAAPIAFDAHRQPLPVRVAIDGPYLDLVLDGAALDGAAFPVTIDPLFGAGDVDDLGDYATAEPDVVYNPRRDEFVVAYDKAGDTGGYVNLLVRRFTSAGDWIVPDGPLAIASSGSMRPPSIAYDQHLDRYLVVWAGSSLAGNRVKAIMLGGDASPITSSFDLIAAGPAGAPDVAARNLRDHGPSETAFVVSWAMTTPSGTALWRSLVTGSAAVTSTTQLTVVPGTVDQPGPSVAYDPRADRFFVAFQGAFNGSVTGWAIAPTGSTGQPITVASSDGTAGQASVAFDVASNRYLVAYSTASGLAGRFVSGGTTPSPLGSPFVLASAPVNDAHVAAEPGAFVVAFPASQGTVKPLIHQRWLATGALAGTTTIDTATLGAMTAAALAIGHHGDVLGAHVRANLVNQTRTLKVSRGGRWFAHAVHGGSGDFTGDGKSDLFVFRPAGGSVHVWSPSQQNTVKFGSQGGIPVLLDWDGDDLVDVGVFRPATGIWLIRLTGTGVIEQVMTLPGLPGDIPVPGDYFGDGADEIAVFRPWTGTWYFRARATPSGPNPLVTATLGTVGDIPVPADWDGDGRREIAVFRQATGQGMWHIRELDGTMLPSIQWGSMGDIPLQGDFVGSPQADQVVYRRAEGAWYVRDGATGAGFIRVQNATGVPMPLDYNGDGQLEAALFQEATGTWAVMSLLPGGSNVSLLVGWGMPGDVPAATR